MLSSPARGGAGAGREEGRGAGYVNDPSPVTSLRAGAAGGGGPGRGGRGPSDQAAAVAGGSVEVTMC